MLKTLHTYTSISGSANWGCTKPSPLHWWFGGSWQTSPSFSLYRSSLRDATFVCRVSFPSLRRRGWRPNRASTETGYSAAKTEMAERECLKLRRDLCWCNAPAPADVECTSGEGGCGSEHVPAPHSVTVKCYVYSEKSLSFQWFFIV